MMDVSEFSHIVFSSRFAVIWVCFHLLSWGYNALIDRLHAREWMAEWTWLTVVVGVGYTLIAALLALWGHVVTGLTAVLVFFLLFVATGTPMAVGDIWRILRWARNGRSALGGVHVHKQEDDAWTTTTGAE